MHVLAIMVISSNISSSYYGNRCAFIKSMDLMNNGTGSLLPSGSPDMMICLVSCSEAIQVELKYIFLERLPPITNNG